MKTHILGYLEPLSALMSNQYVAQSEAMNFDDYEPTHDPILFILSKNYIMFNDRIYKYTVEVDYGDGDVYAFTNKSTYPEIFPDRMYFHILCNEHNNINGVLEKMLHEKKGVDYK